MQQMTHHQDFKSLVLIGAPKAGTSTLARLLDRQPEICMGAEKEPRFFTDFASRRWSGPGAEGFLRSLVHDEAGYAALFRNCPRDAWRLDASTDYLACSAARARLRAWANRHPTRLICILRDPVERAISQYKHTLRDLLETRALGAALDLEQDRRARGWQPLFWHLRRSRYHADVTAWRKLFGRDLLLLDFKDLDEPDHLIRRIRGFLGLPPGAAQKVAAADGSRAPVIENRSYAYRSVRIERWLRRPGIVGKARWLLPAALRARSLALIRHANCVELVPDQDEIARLHAGLAEDSRLCLDDPHIPTDSWTQARKAAGMSSGTGG